ncbi:beta-ketoacyl-ACP synthase [Rhizobacter sp. Root1221]|uniref:beta-ketoacyl-ACP synthase n=1 Tax=Rhizobacter sp. Root1221 TaxID=1736433 RepID=UPI0006F941E5|nr:beta-ketoacyl-ACP synthase [Rhizobacter sp. Root1221]KQV91678.1 3-oxoacyl-ACP synthase [Rhizobacter sp. Root1221]
MTHVYLQSMGVVSALGLGAAAMRDNLFATRAGGVVETDRYTPGRPLHLGVLPAHVPPLTGAPARQRSRNNAVLSAALAEVRPAVDAAIARFGPARVAIVLGVSTAGVEEGERASRLWQQEGRWPDGFDYALQEMGNAAEWLSRELGVCGPAHVISTACSSGAKALASGARLLRAGLVDAVVAGGVDALCEFTIAGFSALESVSAARCNPMSANRSGINIGEGAALFLMGRDPGPVHLAGWGEGSDAHHMSAPDPSGRGAVHVMQQALARAGLDAAAVDYVNLHGTATPLNDAMESGAVAQVLGTAVAASSTKPLTGHALAAAGAIEAAIGWMTLVDNPTGRLPPHWWDGARDPALPPLHLVAPGETLGRAPRHVLSNSFAFGGSNAALLLGAA